MMQKGTTADVIIYDGHIKNNDKLLIGGDSEVIETKGMFYNPITHKANRTSLVLWFSSIH